MRKDRTIGLHGSVCVYSKESIKVHHLTELECPNLEVLWSFIRPFRLPRGLLCIINATVYHPTNGDDNILLDHLRNSLIIIGGCYPGSGIIIAGDFNHLNIKQLCYEFNLKQLVNVPTRGSNILDLVLTNLHGYYKKNSLQIYPPFGLSDHLSLVIQPAERQPKGKNVSNRTVTKRDLRPSRKKELGRYFSRVNWETLASVNTCEQKFDLFSMFVHTGLDVIIPVKKIILHRNDPLWVTDDFKRLIRLREKALHSEFKTSIITYRNIINRPRKLCRAEFYASKVKQLKKSNPKNWWREVKRISGMVFSSGPTNLVSQLQTIILLRWMLQI